MDQHPVPQNISSYEFRLVGVMTLKQFFQLAGGVAVAVVIYQLPLPFIIKWPFMGIAALTGIMLAFVPVSGRPFSQWILAFIRAIYSPTEFHWSESPQPSAPSSQSTSTLPLSRPSTLDLIEDQLFSRFSQIFQHPNLAFSAIQPNQPGRPSSPPSIIQHQIPTSNVHLPSSGIPNLISGSVTTPTGQSIEGVILELVDASGLPVRALRSNKLRKFITATPLPAGTYTLSAEKEGLQFTPLTLNLANQVIAPLTLKAHG